MWYTGCISRCPCKLASGNGPGRRECLELGESFIMKKRWKSFVCIFSAAALSFSATAYASQVTITPLDAAHASSEGESGGAVVSSQGPGTSQDAVSQEGPSGGAAQNGGVSQGGSPSQSGGETQGSSPSQNGGPAQSSGETQGSGPAQSGSASQTSGASQASGSSAASQIAQPTVASEGAVLMNAADGAVLFSKNGDTQFYPASITKLMTALLVAENCSLDDIVTFSATATTNLESGAVAINMTEGDTLTVRQCLYALLLKSANEVGNALAEHVAGSNAAFADMMNAKAAALGCTGTHFVNPHGLNDPNHVTTPHDMALIARAAFQNDIVRTVASTRTYTLPATKNNPSGLTITIGHKMLNPEDSRYYPGIIGGKTGYTSKAGNTLVTVVEKDGVRLIAVVMKSKSTHYTDTKAMLDYGYALAEAGALSGGQAGTAGGAQPGQGTAAGSQAGASGTQSGASGGPGVVSQRGWVQDANGWRYIKDNGTQAAGEWVYADEDWFWIDDNGYMAKGWRQVDGKWYFLRSNGSMAVNYWEKDAVSGKCYYLGADGVMLTDTMTPDGYYVGADGAWVE